MSVETLRAALAAIAVDAEVEAHDRVAVLRPAAGSGSLADAALRRRVALLALEHGFMAIAVEVDE